MIDPFALFWTLLGTCMAAYGIYLLVTEDKRVLSFYVYGKSLDVTKKKGLFWRLFLLPKRYFVHFYVNAVLMFTSSFLLAIIYHVPCQLNTRLDEPLRFVAGHLQQYVKFETATTLYSKTSLLFTLILMMIQSSRRLYECLFISVYSNTSKINILHYIFGHAYYVMAALSTICPILLSQTSNENNLTDLIDNLHKCQKILANLRKDKTGRVITEQHYVPSGGLFEYVSCPHFFLEVIIYLVILAAQEFQNTYWNLIFLLVLTNQTIYALHDHKWYKTKYKDYPKERKAIFPRLL